MTRRFRLPAGLAAAVFLVSGSCFLIPPDRPPFLVSGITVLNGAGGEQRIASVEVEILNRGPAPLVRIRAEMDVYTLQGLPCPGTGTNHAETGCDVDIPPGGEGRFRILLDPLFVYPPGEMVTVSRFCIFRAELADGTVWSDPGRFYQVLSDSVRVEEY